jgi:YVTN family beta-propeller protein
MEKRKKQIALGLTSGRLVLAVWLVGISMVGVLCGLGQQANFLIHDSTLPKNTVITTVTVKGLPTSIVVSPDSTTVYVVNAGSSSVSVIDAKNKYTVKATISVPENPGYLAISPNGKTLYVSSTLVAGTVSVIDATQATYPVVATVTVGPYPEGLAVTPDGKELYVTSVGYQDNGINIEGSVSVVNTATNTVTGTIAANGSPFLLLFTENGKQADVLNYAGTGFLQFINTKSGQISKVTAGGGDIFYPSGMSSDPSATKLYITDLQNYVTVCNASDGTVTGKFLVVPSEFSTFYLGKPALTKNGQYLYVPYESNAITGAYGNEVVTVDTSTGKIVGTPITVGNSPFWVQTSPDGRTLYVSNTYSDTVTVVDISP